MYSFSGGILSQAAWPVVADELPGGLVAQDQPVGTGAVQETQRDGGVAGMVDAPLTLDQHDVRVLRFPRSTNRSAAPAMKSATTASTAMPQPSIMIPVWPVATNRVRRPRVIELLRELQLGGHLADVAVGPHREHH